MAAAPLPAPVLNPAMAATAAADRTRSPALIVDNSPGGTAAAVAGTPGVAGAAKPAPQGLTAEEQFAQRLGGEDASASAVRMSSPSTTVAQGTLMSAVLETALDSDLPGYVRAVISRDVKSFDATRVLIPRGSHVIGQYKSGLAVGQTRAFILWTRLLRPDGVSIALASPATDSAGRNGLGGKVDSHFGKRFGSAILLSLIGAAGQAIGGGNSAVVVAGPQQAVSATAQQNLAIPPTVRVNQGAPIKIFTARDLDFSGVSP
jgi:type IV secretion system protein VirB10